MTICVLHVSDIHIRGASTVSTQVIDEVIRKLRPAVRGKSLVIVAVTGDIAFQGVETEYVVAEIIFRKLEAAILGEGASAVRFAIVPGNHDCDFKSASELRDSIIDSLAQKSMSVIVKPAQIRECVSVQSAFTSFSRKLEAVTYDFDDGLLKDFSIECDGHQIRIFGLNIAWLSRLQEPYGELAFPAPMYADRIKSSTASLNLVLLHQPANWMAQESYHLMREMLRNDNTLVLSGHEHVGNGSLIRSSDGSDFLHVESLALVPEKSGNESGFGTMEIDLDDRTVALAIHKIGLDGPEESLFSLKSTPVVSTAFQLTSSFTSELANPGGNFSGQSKEALRLEDIFVYPDLRTFADDIRDKRVTNSQSIIENKENRKKIILYGQDVSGKTTLLHTAFNYYHKRGEYPIYVQSHSFNSAESKNIQKKIEAAAGEQYQMGKDVLSEKKESLILLIDDIEELQRTPNLLKSVILHCEQQFGRMVISAEQGFNITELVNADVRNALSEGYSYEILTFGHKNRYELVKKWCTRTAPVLREELERKVHLVESTLDTVIGRNLAPSFPLYLLIILQSMEASAPNALQSSSYAHYYRFLITKGLDEAGLKNDKHDEVMNYLSHLAWFVRSDITNDLTEVKLQGFNQAYCTKFHNVILSERLTLLTKARLLSARNGNYTFSYPYIYHYFLAAYLSEKSTDPQVQAAVSQMCDSLREKDSAHTILFLTHHDKSLDVINRVVEVLAKCFDRCSAFAFEKDAMKIDVLIQSTSQRSLENLDCESHQVAERKHRDIRASREERNDERISNDKSALGEFLREMQLLFRTVEIVGQIVKNYYGSLERDEKRKLLGHIFAGPMRLMSAIMAIVGDDPVVLADHLVVRLAELAPDESEEERRKIAKRLAFDFFGMIAFGLILRPAQNVSIEELDQDVSDLVAEQNTVAHRLAQSAYWLVRPGSRQSDHIKKLAAELKGSSPLAYTLLQSLGVMHIRMFSLSEPEKQRLCSSLDINIVKTRKNEVANRKMKKLSSRKGGTK